MAKNRASSRRDWGESLAAGAGALILLVGMSPLIRPAQPSWVVWLLLWSPGVLMLLGERLAWVGKPVAVLKPWHYGMILVCLSAAMLLALGYGLRSLLPAAALTLPQMWAVHGGLNVFGFGLCGILAWRFKLAGKRADSARDSI